MFFMSRRLLVLYCSTGRVLLLRFNTLLLEPALVVLGFLAALLVLAPPVFLVFEPVLRAALPVVLELRLRVLDLLFLLQGAALLVALLELRVANECRLEEEAAGRQLDVALAGNASDPGILEGRCDMERRRRLGQAKGLR